MTRSHLSWAHLATSLVCSVQLLACGGSDHGAEVLTPPKLSLRSIAGVGGSGWQIGQTTNCVELGHDAKQTILVQAQVSGDWLLRPFKDCDKGVQCGFIGVDVTDPGGNELLSGAAASENIYLPFAGVSGAEGTRTFTVRLLTQDGNEFVEADGGTACNPATDCTVSVEVRKSCGTSASDAGSLSDGSALPPPDAAISLDAGMLDATTSSDSGDSSATDSGVHDAAPSDAARLDAEPHTDAD